jgi:hypothetical protein
VDNEGIGRNGILIMERTIYFQGEKQAFNSLDELMEYYLSKNSPATYWVDNDEIQCEAGKNRSIDDLMLMCNHYLPNTEVKELILALQRIGNEKKKYGLCVLILICPGIKKTVVYHGFPSASNISDSYPNFKHLFSGRIEGRSTENSMYTYQELIDMTE